MNYYYDTEFLEGAQKRLFGKTKPTIDLISIGIVSQYGREYYAISKDFNLKEAWNRYDVKVEQASGDQRNRLPEGIKKKVYWIRENVLKPIHKQLVEIAIDKGDFIGLEWDCDFRYVNLRNFLNKYGKSNSQIASEIITFINNESQETIKSGKTLYGYYSAYDHVALCWLFGKMINLPKGFPMYTRDLKYILDEKAASAHLTVGSKADGFSEREYYVGDSYNTREEDMVKYIKEHKGYPKQTNEHSAIHDARWNKQLHEFLKQL